MIPQIDNAGRVDLTIRRTSKFTFSADFEADGVGIDWSTVDSATLKIYKSRSAYDLANPLVTITKTPGEIVFSASSTVTFTIPLSKLNVLSDANIANLLPWDFNVVESSGADPITYLSGMATIL